MMMENSWECDRCVEFREISPGGREMVTSGGEREKHRAWTHDIPPLRNGFQTFPSAQHGDRQSWGRVGGGMGGPGPCRGRGPGDRGRHECQGGAGRAGGP